MTQVRGPAIVEVRTSILDVPMRRAHRHARSTTRTQGVVLVRLLCEDGMEGIGEAVTPGGPWWGGDSPEAIRATIDHYLGPALIGQDVLAIEAALLAMDAAAARAHFAKAALDMALHDAAGRALGVPVSHLLGGRVREHVAVTWPLGIGDTGPDVEEAQERMRLGLNGTFKVKMGRAEPRADVARVLDTAARIGAPCRVDLNQAWDEVQAARWLPALQDGGIELVEAPLAGWHHAAMRRLCERLDMPLMADEGVWDIHDAWVALAMAATDVMAVKVAKAGGLRRARKIAVLAEAAGVPCFGGMALETSVGTAAALQVLATLPRLEWGCELVGPAMLADDIVQVPVSYAEGGVVVPGGPGLGIALDEDRVGRLRRPD